MSESTAPKPGPHLTAVQPSNLVPTESYRDAAKRHARRASELADFAENSPHAAAQLERLVDLALAHAAAAEACAHVAPVARQRLIPCRTKEATR